MIARLLVDEIIARHGAPRVLLSDRGTNFLSRLVAEVCKIFQIQKVNTSSYHPQTDGLVERFNSTLCQSLSMYVARNQKDWDDFIPLILFAHRTSISEAIGDSPFYCLYGREPRLPVDVKFLPPAADDLSTSVLDHRKRIHSQKFRTMSGVTYVATFNAVIGSRLFRKKVTLVPLPTSKL